MIMLDLSLSLSSGHEVVQRLIVVALLTLIAYINASICYANH